MTKKTKNSSKSMNKVANKNLDAIKLLVSWDKFQNDINQIRKEFGIHSDGFVSDSESEIWQNKLLKESDVFLESEYYKKTRKKLQLLRKKDYGTFLSIQESLNSKMPLNKFNGCLKRMVKKYNLPYNFLGFIETYIYYNKISSTSLPVYNFEISIDPEGRKNSAKWISIKAYAVLSEKEIRIAIKDLRNLQKHYLPLPITQNIKIKKDIDKEIVIEKEMNRRINKAIEKPDSYLKEVRKQYGEKEYKRVKKLNSNKVEIIEKYTSSEIAKQFFGSRKKSASVRKIYSRIQKEREKRFGKGVT